MRDSLLLQKVEGIFKTAGPPTTLAHFFLDFCSLEYQDLFKGFKGPHFCLSVSTDSVWMGAKPIN